MSDKHAHDHHGHDQSHRDHGHDHSGHGHGHGHGHDHHNHAAHASHRRLAWALVVTIVAMIIGVIGGVLSGSLALIADAGHMLADAGALGLGLLAARQALRPADASHSYGHERMPVLAAFINGLLLLGASAWIAFEAVQRLIAPQAINGHTMIIVATIGIAANLTSFLLLHGGDKEDLNRRGAAAHVLSDLLGSVAALVAGFVILKTGWLPADPLLSVFAATLVLRTGLRVVRESAHILLEGTPRGLNLTRIAAELPARVEGLVSVHHLHAWSLSQTKKLMTLHAKPDGSVPVAKLIPALRGALKREGITHVTVQIELDTCLGPDCDDHDSSSVDEMVQGQFFEPSHTH